VRVEVDGHHLGVHPATADPARPSDRDRYPATWGALTHEAAHAAHSHWAATIPPTANPAWAEAAILLEESRIEAAQLRRRPGDRRWLRASATEFVLDDFPATPGAPPPSPWQAAHAAALLLARADAGVLDDTETAPVAAVVTSVLGAGKLAALRKVWRDAHTTADTDTRSMLKLGRRWCRILGTDPDTTRPPEPPATGTGTGDPSPLADAVAKVAAAITAANTPPPPIPPGKAAEREAENTARHEAADAAHDVFAATRSKITGTRAPTPAEQAAARRLTRALRQAATRDRTATTLTSPTPPGRLRMRAALAADAQRAAGTHPTAEPFTRTVHRHVPSPPLRVGIACDVSGSMKAFAGPAASAAWILARAASLIPGAQTATVTYGNDVRPITRPGRTPAKVAEFTAPDGTEKFRKAVDALDGALDLSRPGDARLLVIISDGAYTAHRTRRRATTPHPPDQDRLRRAVDRPQLLVEQPHARRPRRDRHRPHHHRRNHRQGRHPRPHHRLTAIRAGSARGRARTGPAQPRWVPSHLAGKGMDRSRNCRPWHKSARRRQENSASFPFGKRSR
jgi:hypothetical protein